MSAFNVQDDDVELNQEEAFDYGMDFTAVQDDDDDDDLGLDTQAVPSKHDVDVSVTRNIESSQESIEHIPEVDGHSPEAREIEDTQQDKESSEIVDQQNTNKEGGDVPTRHAEIDSDSDEKANNTEKPQASEDDSSKVSKRRLVFSSDEEDEEESQQEARDVGEEKDDNEAKDGEPKNTKDIFGSDVDSDVEEGQEKKKESTLMTDIFGDDSDGEELRPEDIDTSGIPEETKLPDSDDDEPKFLRVEDGSGDEIQQSDFDIMMERKRSEKRKRRKRKDGSIDLISDADDQIKSLVDSMVNAANEDRNANTDRRPAIQKRKMLPLVKHTLMKADLFDALLDNGMMSAISEWMAPLPDKSLPALEIRTTLLKILKQFPTLEQGILKQSGLGKAVMFLYKHPKETRENKNIAAKLIRDWARPIFQLDADYSSLSREERIQRDYEHMPAAKRQKLILREDGTMAPPKQPTTSKSEEPIVRPGEAGFIPRARVPKPSTRDYVIRPKPKVEARYKGESKSKANSKLERTTREFQARNKALKVKRAVAVSLEGRKMDI